MEALNSYTLITDEETDYNCKEPIKGYQFDNIAEIFSNYRRPWRTRRASNHYRGGGVGRKLDNRTRRAWRAGRSCNHMRSVQSTLKAA